MMNRIRVLAAAMFAAGVLFAESPVDWREIGTVTAISGGTRLTVTNGVTRTVQFTDDLGEVELDLNSHSITGEIGSAGIKIVHGAGTGTHLKIVDSRQTGTATVCGGDGTWGGAGGAGVEVATDAIGVLISVGTDITVKGGNGSVNRQPGGNGITGDVRENGGTISGGRGGDGGLVNPDRGGDGGSGGKGVVGNVGENVGIIVGGTGGNGGDGNLYGGNGGIGGSGVGGGVEANNGTIYGGAGGNGGDGDFGRVAGAGGRGVGGNVRANGGVIFGGVGVNGGAGVGGDVGENCGTISGGDGADGNDGGNGVGGDVGKNSGTISGGDGSSSSGGNGGNGVQGSIATNTVSGIILGGTSFISGFSSFCISIVISANSNFMKFSLSFVCTSTSFRYDFDVNNKIASTTPPPIIKVSTTIAIQWGRYGTNLVMNKKMV